NDSYQFVRDWAQDALLNKNGIVMVSPVREPIVQYKEVEGTKDQLRSFEIMAGDKGLTAKRQQMRKIDVNLEDSVRATPGGVAAVTDRIRQTLRGEHRAFVYTNTEYRKWVLDLIDGFFVINYMQTAVAVIIAALGIVNTLIISVTERRRELGVLRAVGGLRRQIGRIVLLEAAVLAVVGVISGTIAGMMNTLFLVRTAASMVGGFTIPFHFPIGMVLLALPLTILISLLAAWWPARKAVNLNVVDAIGYE
ncbi:MAG: ABC transporter permease, partial [Acidobacteria bacterium]|nr:ABC transporter permease [Acidobacteriota bacterium]